MTKRSTLNGIFLFVHFRAHSRLNFTSSAPQLHKLLLKTFFFVLPVLQYIGVFLSFVQAVTFEDKKVDRKL